MSNKILLDELYTATNELAIKLSNASYEEIEKFVDFRQHIVEQIEVPLQEDDKQKVQALLAFDNAILSRMQAIKDEAAQWLTKQGAIKSQQSAYQHSYAVDSFFIDNRK